MTLDKATSTEIDSVSELATNRRTTWRTRSLWFVHLGLLLSAAASLATLQMLHVSVDYHTYAGFVFVGLVVVHLVQRRHTVARMATQLWRSGGRRLRLSVSDALLFFITLNLLVSGVVDWRRGSPTEISHLPPPFDRWHAVSAIALVSYLVVHVSRRRKRLRRSKIR